jgi:hypothetical protein
MEMGVGGILNYFQCKKCSFDNYKSLAAVLDGSIVNHKSLHELESALGSNSECSGVFCRNCIADTFYDYDKEYCIACRKISSKTCIKTGRRRVLCNNCNFKNINYRDTIMYYYLVNNPIAICNYIEKTLGIQNPLYETCFHTKLMNQFQCYHCDQDEPSTLNLYVSTSRYNIIERRRQTIIKRQSLLDLTSEQLKQAKNPQDTGVIVLCNVCGRRVTHKDGGFWDTGNMLTRKQTIRYKTMQKKIKEQQCNFCGLKLTPYNGRCFQFDHIDHREKHLSIYEMVKAQYSDKHIQNELEKCRLLCTNCHDIRTFQQQRCRKWVENCPPQLDNCLL